MKYLKRVLMVMVLVSAFLLTYKVSNKITKSTNNAQYNHFNPVVDGDDAVSGSGNRIFFDAFFLEDKDNDGTAEGYHGATIENKETDVLYINVKTNGEATLRNATLTFDSKNVKVGGYIPKNSLFSSSKYNDNFGTIELSEVSGSINTLFTLNTTAYVDKIISDYETNNRVILRGELVDNETGEVTNIEKIVNYTVNSYSTVARTTFGVNRSTYSENSYTVEYIVSVDETYNRAPLYRTYFEGSLSTLLDEKPVSVSVYPEGFGNYTFTYNPDNLTFSAVKNAEVTNGEITKTAYNTISYGTRTTKWHVVVTYPSLEGVSGEVVNLTATAWHTAIKNKDMELFDTNKVSTVLSQQLTTFVPVVASFTDDSSFKFGAPTADEHVRHVDKTPIATAYNGGDIENVKYYEYWTLNSTLSPEYKTAVVYDNSGTFAGASEYLDDYITFNTIRITPCNTNPANKAFKVIDKDKNKIIATIKKDEYGNTFTLPRDTHRIKLETEVLDEGSNVCFLVTTEKEINTSDIISTYTKAQFDYSNLNSGINVYQKFADGTVDLNKLPHRNTASFTEKMSYVSISTDKTMYEREVSEYSIPIELTLSSNPVVYSNQNKWEKGYFLVQMPEFIIDIENLNLSSGVDILSKEHYVENGKHYLWVAFDAHGRSATINANFDAIINPLSTSVSDQFKLYGYSTNPTIYNNPVEDIFDINRNGLTNDEVTYASAYINLAVPNELITGSALSNYTEGNDVTVSPLTADVNPLRGSDEATVNIFVLNNAELSVGDMVLMGRTGYVGNTYVVGSGTLGTEYDTYMNSPITVPSELTDKVEIYYTTKENPTKDLTDTSNGWTKTPTNYNDVKTYLIDFDDSFVINPSERYDFTYSIKLPTTTDNLNKVSYLTHGAFFKYITPSGLYPSSISGSKLGVRQARVYDLELDLYRKYTNTIIPGGLFKLIDDDGEEYSILINNNGHARVRNLRVGKSYLLTQQSAADGVEKNNENVIFKIENGANDELSLIKSGDYKDIIFDGTNKVNITLENDVYYNINLYNKDINDDSPIKGTIFKVKGPNYESGINIVTDRNGTVPLKNLKIGEVYQISQVYIDGYPKIKNFELRIVRDKDTHEVLLTTRQIPQLIRDSSCSSTILYTVESYDPEISRIYTNQITNSVAGTYTCDFTLDLENFTYDYELSGVMNLYDYWGRSDDSTLYMYLTKDDNTSGLSEFDSLGYDGTSYNGSTITKEFATDKVYYMDGIVPSMADLKGGQNYNLRVVYNRSGYRYSQYRNPKLTIDSIRLKPKDGIYELAQTNEKVNVQSSDNPNVYQTIIDTSLNPVVNITVGNMNVEKKTFEITSLDSTNNNIIEGSQFKVSGNGIPGGETIITTDENGKASLDLFLSFSGNYNVVPGISNNPDYPIESEYTIEQVYAPKGYTVNKKKVAFKIDAGYDYSSNVIYSFVYSNNDVKFDSTEVTDVPVFKATLTSSPLFKLLKTDAETNEVLPNTYYAIYSYDTTTQQVSPAKDQYGNIIGDKLTINGVEYYVVKTDNNGEITLPLDSGSYKLIEVLSSNDKYELDDTEYIFSVGDSKPYIPFGATVNSVINSPDSMTTSVPYTFATSDGGFVAFGYFPELHLLKYNSNNELVWNTKLYGYGLNGKNGHVINEYFDDPDRHVVATTSGDPFDYNNSVAPIFNETSDSYYVALPQYNDFTINKTTGEIITDYNSHPDMYQIYKFNSICDNDPSTLPAGLDIDNFDTSDATYAQYILHDPNHVYCNTSSELLNYYPSMITSLASASDKGSIRLFTLPNSYNGTQYYGFKFSDGSKYLHTGSNNGVAIAKYNKNGEMIDALVLNDAINTSINRFLRDRLGDSAKTLTLYGLTQTIPYYHKIRYFDDGSIGLILSLMFTDENHSNIYLVVAIKIDSSGNVVYTVPVGVDGYSPYQLLNSTENSYASINDDGSFSVIVSGSLKYYYFSNYTSSSYPELFQTDFYKYDFEDDTPYMQGQTDASSWYAIEIGANGTLSNVVQLNVTYRVPTYFDNSSMYKRVVYQAAQNPALVSKYEDGYIVAGWNSVSNDSEVLILNNGQTISLVNQSTDGSYNFSMYKVNSDSSVEWFKQFSAPTIGGTYQNGMYPGSIVNGKFVHAIGSTSSQLVDVYNNETYHSADGVSKNGYFFGKFDVTDEGLPGAPTTINLDLLNNRKLFKVEITNNAGGSFTIKNNDNIIYNGDAPGIVEHVKYGDSSINDIIITPNNGYGISSIKINGEDAAFVANTDGSVTLNKIDDVKEDKIIDVVFKRSESRVIVHHYLDGTTDRISGDVIINGNVNDVYVTEPANNDDYTLITDNNGNVVVPDNYYGFITSEPIEVVYYYKRANAKLQVNYFLDNTDIEVAPSQVESKPLGSTYSTSPLTIVRYVLSGVIGDENGVLNRSFTEVSYFYNTLNKKTVTSRHVDEDTGIEIAEPTYQYYDVGDSYNALPLVNIPNHYIHSTSSSNSTGTIGDSDIEVTIYYAKAKGKVVTRYVNKDNNVDIAPPSVQYVRYDDTYYAVELQNVPSDFKLLSKPSTLSGIVNSDEIYLIYYFEKVESQEDTPSNPDDGGNKPTPSDIDIVVPEIEVDNIPDNIINPKTGDNIIVYFMIFIISTTLLISSTIVEKKYNK